MYITPPVRSFIAVPKSYRVPTFLEELTADVSATGVVALECKVIGVPTPRLIWYKDDKELRAGDNYELRAENNSPTTTYKCVAVNCVGSALSEAVLNMGDDEENRPRAKEPPRLLVGMNDVRLKIGTDAQFYVKGKREYVTVTNRPYTCTYLVPFKVNEEAIPCHATWFHNDCKVSPSERQIFAGGPQSGEFTLDLRSLEIADDGVWSIAVRNGLGTVEDMCRLTLKGS